MSIEQLVVVVLALGGVGSLITVLVNIGKTVGWVQDGQAPTYVTGANLFVMLLVYIGGLIKPDLDLPGIDGVVAQVAQILSMIFTLVWPLISSRLTHNALKGTAVIGKSYSFEQARVAMVRARAFNEDMVRRGK